MKLSRFLCTALCAVLLSFTVPMAGAGTVSATPGTFTGVVTFNAPVIANSVEVDARDVTNNYTATAQATQNGPSCMPGSQNWCYSITVESALASNYYLRPIAYLNTSTPFVDSRMPFTPQGPFFIPSAGTVTENLSFQPGEVSGNVTATDMNNVTLPLLSVSFIMLDNSNTFQEPCGGSVAFCPFNPFFEAAATTPQPGPANYQLFLQPNSDYSYVGKAFTVNEATAGQPLAQNVEVFDPNQHFGSLTQGQSVTVNYPVAQEASISGTASLSLPVYNISVSVLGNMLDGLTFSDQYSTNSETGQPLGSANYLLRIFNYADFTKPMNLQTIFYLSADGQTLVQFPPQSLTVHAGDQQTVNFTGTSATIEGSVTFNPPYPTGNIYPGIQTESTQFGLGETTMTTNSTGGTYVMPAFGGNWNYWRFGWNFNLGDPNFTSNYFVDQFLSYSVPVANGQTVQQNFNFSTALLKTFFTAPSGTTITDPQLDISSGAFTNGSFVEDATEVGHAEGLNQNFVLTGEARQVLRVRPNGAFKVRPSAVINPAPNTPGTGRTDFSPFVVQPNQGDVIIVGVPGSLSLTVTSPKEGQVLPTCTVQVTGSATGTTGITITVNGQPVTTTPANNPNDPNQVNFSTTVPGTGSQMTITVVASAQGHAPITDVIHVSATTSKPTVNASVATNMLWPPNHDMINVGLAAGVSSSCDASPTLGVTVFSNESDTAPGSGNMSPDALNLAPGTLRLRAERQGDGQGRVYLIIATGSDHSGDSAEACATVTVPQDQSTASISTVTSTAAAAQAACASTGQAPAGYVQVGIGPVIGPKQ